MASAARYESADILKNAGPLPGPADVENCSGECDHTGKVRRTVTTQGKPSCAWVGKLAVLFLSRFQSYRDSGVRVLVYDRNQPYVAIRQHWNVGCLDNQVCSITSDSP